MSQKKDPFVARKGQAATVIYQRTHPDCKILTVKFPGGYGKTDTIALSYNDKRSTAIVDRLLIIVANDIQLKQILNEFEATCHRIGINLPGGVYPCDSNHPFIRMSRLGTVEVFVTTIQRISATNRKADDLNILRRLLTDGHKWMIAADEYHHYSTGNDWGQALQRLVDLAVFVIATSATPDRDNNPTIFGQPLVGVPYKEAVEEQAVKHMQLRYWHYRVVTEDPATHTTVEFTTEQLRQIIGLEDVDVYLQKKQLRLHPDYLNPVLTGSLNGLLVDRINLHPKCQLLVRAFSCNHARLLCDQVQTYDYEFKCDWVGTGFNGRADDKNEEVLQQFCPIKDKNGTRPEPSLDILVQVGMAGEGFDSIMVSQLTDLSLVALAGNANQTKQFILRGARWIKGGNPKAQLCTLNVGTDHPILDIPNLDLENWFDSNVDFTNPKPREPAPPAPPTPIDVDWHYTSLQEVELLTVSKEDPVWRNVMNEIKKGSTDPDYWDWNNPAAVEQFTALAAQMQKNLVEESRNASELANQIILRDEMKTLARAITKQILERSGLPWVEFQRIITSVNRRAAQTCGAYVEEADTLQLITSRRFLAMLYNEIIKGNLPNWL
jgi:hypothetical protein